MIKNRFTLVCALCAVLLLTILYLSYVPTHKQQRISPGITSQYDKPQIIPHDRVYTWNDVQYVIPALPQYRFFDESAFGYQSIKDFTLTESQPLDVVDFDLLVPDSIGKDPYIHIYSFDLIRNAIISNPDFAKYKSEWIANLGNGTFNALAQLVWDSDKFKKRFPELDMAVVKQKDYVILQNNKNQLSYLMCLGSSGSGQVVTYTSHLHINGTVVFIKVWLSSAYSVDDVLHTTERAEDFIATFLSRNVKSRTY